MVPSTSAINSNSRRVLPTVCAWCTSKLACIQYVHTPVCNFVACFCSWGVRLEMWEAGIFCRNTIQPCHSCRKTWSKSHPLLRKCTSTAVSTVKWGGVAVVVLVIKMKEEEGWMMCQGHWNLKKKIENACRASTPLCFPDTISFPSCLFYCRRLEELSCPMFYLQLKFAISNIRDMEKLISFHRPLCITASMTEISICICCQSALSNWTIFKGIKVHKECVALCRME